MALTLSGTNGVVGNGFTLDPSGVSVNRGVGTFGSLAELIMAMDWCIASDNLEFSLTQILVLQNRWWTLVK